MLLKHPRLLLTLSYSEGWERFAYYATQMLIVLYCSQKFNFTQEQAYALYGAVITCAFALPFFGGFIADRLLGHVPTIICGGFFLVIGNILLCIPSLSMFLLGLALFLLGSGLYKANCTALVGNLYRDIPQLRERGYTLFYMAMNIGATLGPLLFGLTSERFGWTLGFAINALGISTVLILFVKNFKKFEMADEMQLKISFLKIILLGILFLLVVSALYFLLKNSLYFGDFLLPIAIVMLLFLGWLTMKESLSDRRHIFLIVILSFFGMLFFVASFQIGSVLNIFVDKNVVHDAHWSLVITGLYPFSVIVMAPIINVIWRALADKNKEPSELGKLFIGLIFASIAFIFFYFAARSGSSRFFPLLDSVLGIWCFGIGELALMPAIFSSISGLAPKDLQGTLMGTWFLFIAFAGYLSTVFNKFSMLIVHSVEDQKISFSAEFLVSSALMLVIALGYLALIPVIKKLR
jgi:POT family proton-dependent oligopeptide transporter